jgi:hypothetical protein
MMVAQQIDHCVISQGRKINNKINTVLSELPRKNQRGISFLEERNKEPTTNQQQTEQALMTAHIPPGIMSPNSSWCAKEVNTIVSRAGSQWLLDTLVARTTPIRPVVPRYIRPVQKQHGLVVLSPV